MADDFHSLSDLAEATGIEPRTIRSYIERGLLAPAETRGRAATYSREHLSRLRVIMYLRRARPNISLSEIRVVLQGLNLEQLHAIASGSITAATRAIEKSSQDDGEKSSEVELDDENELPKIDWQGSASQLTGAERIVRLLRDVVGFTSPTATSKVEAWQRIAVTPDIEFSVRAEFSPSQLMAFRELADILRHLLQRTDALSERNDE